MYEINLIKDRVVPISKKLLRTFIISAYFILVLFASVVILIVSMDLDSKIEAKQQNIKEIQKKIKDTTKEVHIYEQGIKEASSTYQELASLKKPWVDRVNFPHLIDNILKAWDTIPGLGKYAYILKISYDAKAGVADAGRVIIMGIFEDKQQSPMPEPAGFDKVERFSKKTLQKLKADWLADPEFTSQTNIRKIDIELSPAGFAPGQITSDNICYYKLILQTAEPLFGNSNAKKEKK